MLVLLRRVGLPHAVASPLRSALVVLGIALGVAVVVASRATSDALARTFDELVQRIAGRADLIVVGGASGLPAARVAEIAAVPGVEHAAAALEVTTHFVADGEPLLILGVDLLGDAHFLQLDPPNGGAPVLDDPLAFVNEPDAIIVSAALAARRELRVGDAIELSAAGGARRFTVRAIAPDHGPATSFGGQVAVMFIDAAQIAFERGTLVDRVDVALAPGADRRAVSARLQRALGPGVLVQLPEDAGRRLRGLIGPLADGLRLTGLLALLVAGFIIYNAVGVAVAQRRRELGLMRALGALRRDVVLGFCGEALLLALLGIALGSLLSQQLVQLAYAQTRGTFDQVLGSPLPVPRITLAHTLLGSGAALVVGLLAAWLPAWRGARLDPVAALRPTSHVIGRRELPSARLALAGAVLWVLAVPVAAHGRLFAGYVATLLALSGAALLMPVFMLLLRATLLPLLARALGVTGRLGLDHVARDLGRSSSNVLAVMVAVALGIGFSSWLHSFEHAVREWFEQVSAADMVVTAGSPISDRRHMPLAQGSVERLAGVPGIAELQPMRLVDQPYGRHNLRLLASDTRAYLRQAAARGKPWRVLEGRAPIGERELFDTAAIVLSENAAHHLRLHAGDRIRLDSPSGPVELQVRAVVVDFSSELGAGFVDLRHYAASWQDTAVDQLNLYLAPGADPEQVAREVRARLGGGKALFVTGTGALREELMRSAERAFAYTRSLELILLVIAVLGVLGTMLASVLDRTRELGVLRAIGATRRQVVLAVVIEAAFLGLCGALGGVVAGSLHSLLLLQTVIAHSTGWNLPFAFPFAGALRVCALALTGAALAGLLPGLRAARLDAKTALAAE